MNEKITYMIDERTLQEYFSRYLPNIDSFIQEMNMLRQFIKNKVLNVIIGGIFIFLVFSTPPGTYWAVLNFMYLFMWMFIHSHCRKKELEAFTMIKMLVNDPSILEKNFGSAKEAITQSHFQLLSQLASKEGYYPGMYKEIPALGKHGLKKAIQRLSADKRVKDVPLVNRDEHARPSFVPWHFEIEKTENSKILKNGDREEFQAALDYLWINMLENEHKFMGERKNITETIKSLIKK